MIDTEFPKLLKKVRLSLKITQKSMAETLNISERAYQHYELGTREPSLDTLIAIANEFHQSLDYLTGRTITPVGFDPEEQVYLSNGATFSLIDCIVNDEINHHDINIISNRDEP